MGYEVKRQREHARLWRDASLANLELLQAQFVTQTFAPHTHDTYAIGMVFEGAEYFDYRGRREAVFSGSLGVVHPGELHTGGPLGTGGWRYCGFYPDAAHMTRVLDAVDCKTISLPFFREPVITDAEVFGQLLRAHAAFEQAAPELERESRFIWALTSLVQRHANHADAVGAIKRERGLVTQMVGYLHDNLPGNVRLADLSTLTRMSEFKLLRVFRAEMGLPPHAYLNQLRVRKAKTLLMTGMPPATVAAETGFADQAHLTRNIKRMLGVTPGAILRDRRHEHGHTVSAP